MDDPFSAENAPGVSLIVLLRIYDLLGAILTNLDHEQATALLEMHKQGRVFLDYPWLDTRD